MTWHVDMPDEYKDAIVTGDALTLLRTLPDASVPLFLFSPPYNLGNTTGGGFVKQMGGMAYQKSHYSPDTPLGKRGGVGKWSGGKLAYGYDTYDDALPHAEYVQWQNDILNECWRCLDDRGAIFYNHKPRVLAGRLIAPIDYVPDTLRPYVRQEIIWARAGGVNFSPSFYVPTHERVVIIARPGWRLKSKGASGVGDVWYIPQESSTWHPAPFPLPLALRVMETTGARLVCDPFAGSGTTAKAAKISGAHWIGFDRNPAYVECANEEVSRIQPMQFVADPEQLPLAV